MKVIYTACKNDYLDPKRGYGFEHYNFLGSLEKMHGVEVIYYPYDQILEIGKDEFNKKLLQLVKNEKPDLLFAAMYTDQLKTETLNEISKIGCKTFAWFCDDVWRFYNYSKYWAPHFDWVASTDPKALKNYAGIGYKNIIKTQFACNHFLYKPANLPKIYDVAFIGQPHGTRKKIVEKLKNAGIKVECWGKGWPNGRVSQDDMIKIFFQSKINLNFAAGSAGLGIKVLPEYF